MTRDPTFPQVAAAMLGLWSLLVAFYVGIFVFVPKLADWFDDDVKCCACRLEPGKRRAVRFDWR